MTAEPVRRSRFAWPHGEAPEPEVVLPIPPHRHRSARRIWAALIALYVVVALLSYLVVINYQFVLGRGHYRDQETARVQAQTTEQIRQAMCALLDGLPAGPLLDPARDRYNCGPGVAGDDLTPEQQGQLQQFSDGFPTPVQKPGVKPLPGTAPPTVGQPAEPSQEPPAQPAPATSTPAPSAAPAPGLPPVAPEPAPTTAPPLVDVGGLTDQVCRLTGVCA
jgi:hypothetical protein